MAIKTYLMDSHISCNCQRLKIFDKLIPELVDGIMRMDLPEYLNYGKRIDDQFLSKLGLMLKNDVNVEINMHGLTLMEVDANINDLEIEFPSMDHEGSALNDYNHNRSHIFAWNGIIVLAKRNTMVKVELTGSKKRRFTELEE